MVFDAALMGKDSPLVNFGEIILAEARLLPDAEISQEPTDRPDNVNVCHG